MEVRGKTVLVTGASSGIGKATARRLAADGATVLLVARSADKLARTAEAIAAAGGTARAFPADLADPDAAAALADAVLSETGAPDIILHGAGTGRWALLLETTLDEARQMIETPYLAAVYVTRLFLPAMWRAAAAVFSCSRRLPPSWSGRTPAATSPPGMR